MDFFRDGVDGRKVVGRIFLGFFYLEFGFRFCVFRFVVGELRGGEDKSLVCLGIMLLVRLGS